MSEWKNYFSKQQSSAENGNLTFNFNQDSRKEFYNTGIFNFPLEKLRQDFSLRSTFFSVEVIGDTVMLSGRGYGHGVGLCQEGAMVMATRGYSFSQIITFYFSGVRIIDAASAKMPERIVNTF